MDLLQAPRPPPAKPTSKDQAPRPSVDEVFDRLALRAQFNARNSFVGRARSASPNVRKSKEPNVRATHLNTSLDEVLSMHDARSARKDRMRLKEAVKKGLAASRSRSLSREKVVCDLMP